MKSLLHLVLVTLLALVTTMAGAQGRIGDVAVYGTQVLSVRPHDKGAFTQGLVYHEGKLYESTGQYGQSTLRRVEPTSGTVELQVALPADVFAEGLAMVDNRLIQLTWKEKRAFIWDRDTFEKIGEFSYEGEGWGLTYDGTQLIMSDGTPILRYRDPKTFAVTGEIEVTANNQPLPMLNELEYHEGLIYANVWQRDFIAAIDPDTGNVIRVISAAGILAPQEKKGTDVLNGIAYDTKAQSFLITGKYWPRLFEVRFLPAELEQ